MLTKEIKITRRKLSYFYRMRCPMDYPFKNDRYNKEHDLPSYAESLAMYHLHSEKFGIAGRGTLTIKDFR